MGDSDKHVSRITLRVGVKVTPLIIETDSRVMCLSNLINGMIGYEDDDYHDDEDEDHEIPLPHVDEEPMEKVMEFLNYHVKKPMKEIVKPIQKDAKFEEVVKDEKYRNVVDFDLTNGEEMKKFFQLIGAASYLDIPKLMDLCFCKLTFLVMGKSPNDVRKLFRIDELSPEQDRDLRKNNPWIFDVEADQIIAEKEIVDKLGGSVLDRTLDDDERFRALGALETKAGDATESMIGRKARIYEEVKLKARAVLKFVRGLLEEYVIEAQRRFGDEQGGIDQMLLNQVSLALSSLERAELEKARLKQAMLEQARLEQARLE